VLEHGGRLRRAAEHFGIPLADWLDLSTGINPHGWPVPAPPPEVWTRLPEEEDGLEKTARGNYGSPVVLPVAGSQAAIQALPQLRAPCRVGVLAPGYAEHAHAWKRAGHAVVAVAPESLTPCPASSSGPSGYLPRNLSTVGWAKRSVPIKPPRTDGHGLSAFVHPTRLKTLLTGPGHTSWDVLVVINPNNPTGHFFPPDWLLAWHERLSVAGGWLVVDEAFMDVTPEFSLAPQSPRPGLIVLRSLGKFFGLAGARVGFVIAEPQLLRALHERLGPWAVNAPARWVATRALLDREWQAHTRQRLVAEGERLTALLSRFGLMPAGGCALFQWVPTPDAATIHGALARRGILVRLFEDPPGLRFGLPGSEAAWARLENALAEIMAGEGR
jgi:cobalamin biosynthetic protein CobC